MKSNASDTNAVVHQRFTCVRLCFLLLLFFLIPERKGIRGTYIAWYHCLRTECAAVMPVVRGTSGNRLLLYSAYGALCNSIFAS